MATCFIFLITLLLSSNVDLKNTGKTCFMFIKNVDGFFLSASQIQPCNRTDPHLYQCVQKNIEILKPDLKKGVPELFIPALDPLIIRPTCVNEADQVKVTFTVSVLKSFKNFTIKGYIFHCFNSGNMTSRRFVQTSNLF